MKKFVHRDELSRYHSMPKVFVGPEQADDLFLTYEKLVENTASWAYVFAAGSAAAESGLRANHRTTKERHSRVDRADVAWQLAQQKFLDIHQSDDWSDSKLLTIPHRIEMNRIFTPLYHDFIDGNIREETIDRTHQRLVRLSMQNYRNHTESMHHNDGSHVVRRGLGYELGTIMAVTRLRCPSFFAIPAIARADHGAVDPEYTHDVNLIRQSWGKIEEWTPYEVKPAVNDRKYGRYLSALVAGWTDLKVGQRDNDPLYLAKYMDREQKGLITPEETKELDRVTSNILSKTSEYKVRAASNKLPVRLGPVALDAAQISQRIAPEGAGLARA